MLWLARFGIEREDIEELITEGLIHPQTSDNETLSSDQDLQWIEILTNLRRAGLTRELGFQVESPIWKFDE